VILADTSVWIDHLRTGDQALAALLDAGMVLAHPFVIGEPALGNLRQREIVLNALADLPHASIATRTRKSFISSSVTRCPGVGSDTSMLICSPLSF
jgi:predicted nucleic acid-binding protein